MSDPVADEILGRRGKPIKRAKVKQESGFLHRLSAGGCYLLAFVLAFVALGVMWVLVFYPSEFVAKVLIAVITLIIAVIFLWSLLIKKWFFLD